MKKNDVSQNKEAQKGIVVKVEHRPSSKAKPGEKRVKSLISKAEAKKISKSIEKALNNLLSSDPDFFDVFKELQKSKSSRAVSQKNSSL